MKTVLAVLLVAVLIVAVVAPPADAWVRHPHVRVVGPVGILAAPLLVASALVAAPFIIAGSAIAAVTAPVVAPPPPVVIAAPAPPVPTYYWYYCRSPQGYYPYVPQCATGWLRIVPRS